MDKNKGKNCLGECQEKGYCSAGSLFLLMSELVPYDISTAITTVDATKTVTLKKV